MAGGLGMMRRRLLLAAALAPFAAAVAGSARSQERVVRITSRKFTFDPGEVTLKAGEPVVLELTTEDVHMGFKAVDLGLRADILPGRVTRLRLTPEKAGSFPFFCDVFCGDDHELMSGTLIVN
jgi:cytochrome c oxidase subunit 2